MLKPIQYPIQLASISLARLKQPKNILNAKKVLPLILMIFLSVIEPFRNHIYIFYILTTYTLISVSLYSKKIKKIVQKFGISNTLIRKIQYYLYIHRFKFLFINLSFFNMIWNITNHSNYVVLITCFSIFYIASFFHYCSLTDPGDLNSIHQRNTLKITNLFKNRWVSKVNFRKFEPYLCFTLFLSIFFSSLFLLNSIVVISTLLYLPLLFGYLLLNKILNKNNRFKTKDLMEFRGRVFKTKNLKVEYKNNPYMNLEIYFQTFSYPATFSHGEALQFFRWNLEDLSEDARRKEIDFWVSFSKKNYIKNFYKSNYKYFGIEKVKPKKKRKVYKKNTNQKSDNYRLYNY